MTPTELMVLRKQYGLSQAELGARLGTSRLTISNWERARFAIPHDIASRLAAADLVAPSPLSAKETDKQRLARESEERQLAKHWLDVYRALRAWPDMSNHNKAMALFRKQGHVIPQCAYAAIVAEFPDILSDPDGHYPMSPAAARAAVLD